MINESLGTPEVKIVDQKVFGKKVGLFSKFFGCRHHRMSRPVTTACITYKYCADCGIRRQFDPVTFKPIGRFYYPETSTDLHHI